MPMKLHGGAELERAFKAASSAIKREGLEASVVPEMEAVMNDARHRTRSSRIAASLRTEVAEVDDQHIDVVGGPSDKLFWALFEEFGTDPREQGEGIHPGTTARPFLRPAMDGRIEQTVTNIGRTLGERIESAAVA